MDYRTKFYAAREAWLKAKERTDTLIRDAESKYGAPYYVTLSYKHRGIEARINAAREREMAKEQVLFGILDTISRRDWRTGAPAGWILRELSFEDAITRGPLSVVPPPAYGSCVYQMQRFAAALPGYYKQVAS
jgi:hypothetical protein